MSARQLARLKKASAPVEDRESEEEEEEEEARRPRASAFELLSSDSDSASEAEKEPRESSEEAVSEGAGARRGGTRGRFKGKAKGRAKGGREVGLESADDDVFSELLAADPPPVAHADAAPRESARAWLRVGAAELSVDALMQRRFGAAADEGRRRAVGRRFAFGAPREGWSRPPHLAMRAEPCAPPSPHPRDRGQWFRLAWSPEYTALSHTYAQVQRSGDANALCTFLGAHPYHAQGLLQLALVFARTGHLDKAAECVRMALFALEHWLPDQTSLLAGLCRFDAALPENRVLFDALFLHAHMCCMLGCPSVSAAVALLLLSLDPSADPFCALLCLDFYLLAAGRHETIASIVAKEDGLSVGPGMTQRDEAQDAELSVRALPNWAFSHAVSLFLQGADRGEADEALQRALNAHPSVLGCVLSCIEVSPEAASPLDWRPVCGHDHFRMAPARCSPALEKICRIYAARNRTFWKREPLVRWLHGCARALLAALDAGGAAAPTPDPSALLLLGKYAQASEEDFLEEFPRLPPEANPLDPRFLVPGAPAVPPAGRQQRNDQGFPDLDLAQQIAQMERFEQMRGPRDGGGFLPAAAGAAGNLGPDLPLTQLFLQSLMPWNRFDPGARDNDE